MSNVRPDTSLSSPCIAHGIDLSNNHQQQQLAVKSGHWPLFRYDPSRIKLGKNPMHLDSAAPSIPYKDFIHTEARFDMLWQTHPENAEKFLAQAQRDVNHRYHYYQQLAELDWSDSTSVAAVKANFKHAAKEI